MACEQLADSILRTATGRADATGALAVPCLTDAVANWRGGLLNRARHAQRDFVLDVYDTALGEYGPEHMARCRQAWRLLLTRGATPTVLATARWWGALHFLERRHRELVKERRGLCGRDYLLGVRLYASTASTSGGTR
jgi:FtsH ternary system-associated peptide